MRNRTRPARRGGSILIVALVALVIVVTMIGALLVGTLRERRQLRVERDRRQTELLLQAGLDRALQKLSTAADYRGETWDLPAEAGLGSEAARVTIEVKDNQLHVLAEYPPERETSIRRSRTIRLPRTSRPTQE